MSSRFARVVSGLALLAGLTGGALPAAALPIFQMNVGPGDMQNNWNVPKITLQNLSTAGETIVGLALSIGASGYVYDFVANLASNPAGRPANVATEAVTGATLVAGDRLNGSGSVTTLVWSFAHFSSGEALVFEVDLDRADGTATVDARTIWFNNGAAPNAEILVTFSSGATALVTMPDAPGSPSGLQLGPMVAVPEPATASLMVLGLLGLYSLGGRSAVLRRRAAAALQDASASK